MTEEVKQETVEEVVNPILKEFKKRSSRYNESNQTKALYYSFVNKEGEYYTQLHPVFKCRDYFTDCIVGNALSRHITAYGFSWNPQEHKLDTDKTRFLVHTAANTTKMLELITQHIGVINQIEQELGIEQTVLIRVSKTDIIIEADIGWINFPLTFNLYTLVLKLLTYLDKDDHPESVRELEKLILSKTDISGTEITYLQQLQKNFLERSSCETLHELILFVFQNATIEKDLYSGMPEYVIHDTGGVVTFYNIFYSGHGRTSYTPQYKTLVETFNKKYTYA